VSGALVGVLALQGDFAAHRTLLEELGATVREVRVPADLEGLAGLVIPGGESTTMTLGIAREGNVTAISFHPELSGERRIHARFLQAIDSARAHSHR
jgi:glutamine amidotransferase PdxT